MSAQERLDTMATIEPRKNKHGTITGYRLRSCIARDGRGKQVWRTCTIPRPEGLTPVREQKEVQRIADDWEREQKESYDRTGAKGDRDRITLESFIRDHWWEDHVMDGEHKPSTVSFFRYMSDDILEYFGHQKRLKQIDTEAVKRYIKYLRTDAHTKAGEPYSASTIQHHYKTLVNILDYAKRMRYVLENPCDGLSAKEKPHKDKGKTIDFLDSEQARCFMACLEDEPLFWKTFMNVLIVTGLRRGECLGLQWIDIDHDRLILHIERNVTIDRDSPEKYRVGATKTGESRTVPLSRRVYGLLMDLKREHEERLQMKLMPTMFVFSRTTDPRKPIYPTEPTRWQRQFVKRHGLPNVSPHDLRHTAATLALEAGANLKEIQQLLGHADPATTMAFYTGVTEETQRRTVDGIESLIG